MCHLVPAGVFLGLEKGGGIAATAKAETDVLLYTWSIGDLETMATQLAPAGRHCCCTAGAAAELLAAAAGGAGAIHTQRQPARPLNASTQPFRTAVSTFWRNFALCTLGLKLTWGYRPDEERICAMGLSEDAAVQKGALACRWCCIARPPPPLISAGILLSHLHSDFLPALQADAAATSQTLSATMSGAARASRVCCAGS